MHAAWEFRQFRLSWEPLSFAPTVVTNAPLPELFDPSVTTGAAAAVRQEFVSQLALLAPAPLARMRVRFDDFFGAGQSAPFGTAQPNYLERVLESDDATVFVDEIDAALQQANVDGCDEDPITHASVLRRATALSCAGCHSPRLIGPEQRVGCGLVWPDSLGETHIDEYGALSEALTDVFLPHRADVLSTYLQACDKAAIVANLQPVPSGWVECFAAGTPITMADGSNKPIEQVRPGEFVLSFDEASGSLVPTTVVTSVERPHADRVVVINGTLVATTNHPFYSAGRWVRADALEIGTPLFALNDGGAMGHRLDVAPTRVEQLMLQPGNVATYNLEVAEHHSYFAAGLLVHDRP
jgi:hypothetical protein